MFGMEFDHRSDQDIEADICTGEIWDITPWTKDCEGNKVKVVDNIAFKDKDELYHYLRYGDS